MIEDKRKKKRGRGKIKHGGYSLVYRDEVLRKHREIKRYLEDVRAGLVRDVAGTEEQLTTAQKVLIDKTITMLGTTRMIESFVSKFGIFRRDRLKDQVFELEPSLGINYLAFNNSIRLSLSLLGIEKREASDILDLGKYIEQKDAEKAASETKKDEPGTKEPENA